MSLKNTSHWKNYEESLGRVRDYVYDHLDEDLDLYQLADIACLSPYHWHRVYHALYGETLAVTVKRLRLQRAAVDLAQTSLAVKEIAKRSGYHNLESFTRIFKSVYGMPPAQYRSVGSHTQFAPNARKMAPATYEIAITIIPNMHALSINHVGSYLTISKAFDTLYGWLGTHHLLRTEMRSIGLFYDDPSAVPEKYLRSRACLIIDEPIPLEAPLVYTEIAGGPHAVLSHKGPYADMRAAYQWLYGEWLVQSGKEVAHTPVFEEYLNSPRDTPPADLLTQIYLPLSETLPERKRSNEKETLLD